MRMDLTGAGMREQVPENEWVHKIRVMSINISKPKRNTRSWDGKFDFLRSTYIVF